MEKILLNYRSYIEAKEKVYFWICVVSAVLLYLILLVTIIGITYFLLLGLCIWILQGLFIGHLKANAVKLSEKQYPEAYQIAADACANLEYMKMPDIYVIQEGGMLNAMATKFCGKNFVVIYSDVLEVAYNEGLDALRFIMAHELAHHKRNHLLKHAWLMPALFIPFLGAAYSRACEYSCDSIATFIQPNNAINGLLILLAGTKLYKKLNVTDYLKTAQQEIGFWSWFAEITASHPHLCKRILKVKILSESLIDGGFKRADYNLSMV